MIVAVLMAAAVAEEAPIIVKAFPWAPFISPMGEPFRPPSTGEAPIARWFVQADRNQDGMLTADEMQADAERFFVRLDSNHDGQIDPDERRTYELEIAPEIQVNSDWRQARGQPKPKHDDHDGYNVNGLQGAARYGILNIPQPVASADADFNRAITLTEFRQAASSRFKLLDGRGQGWITLPELEARLPARPKGKRPKPSKNAVDTRVGVPLPEGD
ncbi:MAG TPA: EF-hand domain-containing protein [Sphingomicrobium sp.]|nr:EF-hand domain-containing protein [Sphingomicrobium sp.]